MTHEPFVTCPSCHAIALVFQRFHDFSKIGIRHTQTSRSTHFLRCGSLRFKASNAALMESSSTLCSSSKVIRKVCTDVSCSFCLSSVRIDSSCSSISSRRTLICFALQWVFGVRFSNSSRISSSVHDILFMVRFLSCW